MSIIIELISKSFSSNEHSPSLTIVSSLTVWEATEFITVLQLSLQSLCMFLTISLFQWPITSSSIGMESSQQTHRIFAPKMECFALRKQLKDI